MAWAKSPVISEQRGDKEIAKAVAFKALAGGEAMAEEPGDQMFVFRKSHHAIAQIARRQHVKAAAQPSAGAPVIGHGDHGSQIGDEAWRGIAVAGRRVRRCDIAPEPAQQGGKAGASADGHGTNAGAVGAPSSGQWLSRALAWPRSEDRDFTIDAVTKLTYARKRYAGDSLKAEAGNAACTLENPGPETRCVAYGTSG